MKSIKPKSTRRLTVAIFTDEEGAQRAVEQLIEKGFPMDSISILGRAKSSGDDLLGIYYDGVGKRMKAWGLHGAFWGGLWGLLSSAAGVFVLPGVGALLAAGPIVEALIGALAGATITGGAMAGAAAISELTLALHRMGVPEERLDALQSAIKNNNYVLLLRCHQEEVERWRTQLAWSGAENQEDYPYYP